MAQTATQPVSTGYGAEFLAALDALVGRRVFGRTVRQELKEMDRDGVVRKLRSFRYEWCQAAKTCSPQELAEKMNDFRIEMEGKVNHHLTLSMILLTISLLLMLSSH